MSTSANKTDSRPMTRWLNHLTCPLFVVTAAVMAFPQIIGSSDEPTYSLAIAFLALAVVFGVAVYARESENGPTKEKELINAANEFSAGNITLEEYGSQTNKILEET